MKTRPILFSAPMVRALLDGHKTQTRRALKPQPEHIEWFEHQKGWLGSFGKDAGSRDNPHRMVPCPYGQPGDRLWVRETWMPCRVKGATEVQLLYKASNDLRPDGESVEDFGAAEWFVRPEAEADRFRRDIERMEIEGDHWRPSIHMPRWASRITLEIKSVRVERLRAISRADTEAEGVGCDWQPDSNQFATFQRLWESLNGAGSWNANPWVWVVEFARVSNAQVSHEPKQ